MKKLIISCLAVVAIALASGCGTDKTHRTTTTSQETTIRSPVTTTTTDTETK